MASVAAAQLGRVGGYPLCPLSQRLRGEERRSAQSSFLWSPFTPRYPQKNFGRVQIPPPPFAKGYRRYYEKIWGGLEKWEREMKSSIQARRSILFFLIRVAFPFSRLASLKCVFPKQENAYLKDAFVGFLISDDFRLKR